MLVVPLVASLLGGCASDAGTYPSLARREGERLHGTLSPVPVESGAVTAPPSAELLSRLERLVGQAEAAQSRFAEREPRARQLMLAATGAPVGSENWSVATIAYADLESARSDAMIALADLDLLHASATVEGAATPAIFEARERVIRLVAEQDRVLAELRNRAND